MKAPSLFNIVKMIWQILSGPERRRWLLIVGLAAMMSALEVMTAVLIVGVVQSLNDPQQASHIFHKLGIFPGLSVQEYMKILLLGFSGLFLFKSAFAAFEVFCQSLAIQSISRNLKNRMLSSYSNAGYGFYQTRTSSHLLNVISGDVDMFSASGLVALATIMSECCVLIFLFITVTIINPQATLTIAALCMVVGFLLFRFLLPRFYRWGKVGQQTSQESHQILIEFFQGFKEVLLYGQRAQFRSKFDQVVLRKAVVAARHQTATSIPRISIEIIFVGLFVFTVLFLISKNTPMHEIAGLMGAYLYAGFRMMPGLNRVIVQSGNLKLVSPNIERIRDEIMLLPESASAPDIPSFTFNEDIALEHVSFSYAERGRPAVQDISLKIRKGEIIGITGETGSGKSTLMDLILGLHPPTAGSILIDGKYPAACQQWHQIIGYVPQSVYLFDGTLRENILFGVEDGDRVDRAFLEEIIKDAQLERMISRLPQGLDTPVGERGIRLSGGERQRIAIARALCRRPEVLIFDEATSALDNETEMRLMETIRHIVQGRTVIMIAHRLTTLQNCDRIYVLDSGLLARVSSFDDL